MTFHREYSQEDPFSSSFNGFANAFNNTYTSNTFTFNPFEAMNEKEDANIVADADYVEISSEPISN
jgi:hypothetical protein